MQRRDTIFFSALLISLVLMFGAASAYAAVVIVTLGA